MNRLGVIAATGLLTLSLAGCGSSGSSNAGQTSTSDTASDAATSVSADASVSATGDTATGTDEASSSGVQTRESKYAVTINSATPTTDYDGNPAVVVNYTFTNNSDDTTSMAAAVYAQVFQNGVQCDTAFVTDVDEGGYMSDLRPGASIDVNLAYSVADTSDIEVEVTELISLDDTPIAYQTFPLA